MKSLVGALAALVAISVPATAGGGTTSASATGDIIGRLRFTLADGTLVTRDALRGRVVVINFWATWCAPCRKELPLLNLYYRAHRADGLVVIGVAADPGTNGKGQWVSPSIAYPQAARVGGPDYELHRVPMNYVLGRDGRIRFAHAGSFTRESLEKIVGPLLTERAN